ncbi:DNA-formamidopyrimidine glycosylase family protein [Paracnuella aquatica]|uniref:DNA-formamidopyrimidine glycosylase family protein n=1 Tax=Paracnuella aquatica TaxID=2268757 RepID=UPI000DEFA9B6|nr:DNA-formamidopyrimidine glycosylase family protein [Paracnuella aquatica]RPD43838.1 endonuclease [Paracnuella aquatica]
MEGPSLVLLKEEASKFVGKRIDAAEGTSKLDMDFITGQKLTGLATWGKHLLLLLERDTIRIHYLMFGNYYIDSRHPEKEPKLSLYFATGQWHHYSCAVKLLNTTNLDVLYDWSTDVMNDAWSTNKTIAKLKDMPHRQADDLLLDQQVFSGVGNIIKNEVLHRIGVHPESKIGSMPNPKLKALVTEARHYCFQFLDWKREGTLRQHWLAHTKKTCSRCGGPITKQHTGLTPRRSFFCTNCQVKYG